MTNVLHRLERAVQRVGGAGMAKRFRAAQTRLRDFAVGRPPTRTVLEEVWNQNRDESQRQDISHWRGVGRWADVAKWAAIGKKTLADLDSLARFIGTDPVEASAEHVVLEWGPGGGTNLSALAPFSRRLYGVDISEKNLGECGRVLRELGKDDTFEPLLVGEGPEPIADLVSEPVDILISTAVFQHFPSKAYGARVLRTMARVMRPGGIGCIQIRFDNGNPKYAPKDERSYAVHHITATSYRLDEFWTELVTAGFEPQLIKRVNTKVNYAVFLFTRPG